MKAISLLLGFGLFFTLLVGMPTNASAQCHKECGECPKAGFYHGEGGGIGAVSGVCTTNPDCSFCERELVSENSTVVDYLSSQLEAATNRHAIRRLAREHAGRLLVHSERHMVVVLGGCDGLAPVSAVFLPTEMLRELERAGVTSLDEYYAATELQER